MYEGRAISLNMTFETTFSWLDPAEKDALHNDQVEMMWDVAVSQDDWVILGRKKGQYTAEVSSGWSSRRTEAHTYQTLSVRPAKRSRRKLCLCRFERASSSFQQCTPTFFPLHQQRDQTALLVSQQHRSAMPVPRRKRL